MRDFPGIFLKSRIRNIPWNTGLAAHRTLNDFYPPVPVRTGQHLVLAARKRLGCCRMLRPKLYHKLYYSGVHALSTIFFTPLSQSSANTLRRKKFFEGWGWGGIKASTKNAKVPASTKPVFSKARIARRFLSLFADMKYIHIAAELGVTSSTVSEWKKHKSTVPWEKLDYAVGKFGLRWDWLLDGLEPKHRE